MGLGGFKPPTFNIGTHEIIADTTFFCLVILIGGVGVGVREYF